ncbi:hypothetical protein GGI21_005308, partial [Coemansia aciculifera]
MPFITIESNAISYGPLNPETIEEKRPKTILEAITGRTMPEELTEETTEEATTET